MSRVPYKSLVKVFFPERRTTLTYFNDMFHLEKGDTVFVEGSLAGLRGRVVEVCNTFKIKRSDYKKVIAVADTELIGDIFIAEKSVLAFDPPILPFEKVRTWFLPPVSVEDEYEMFFGEDEEISIENLEKMKIDPVIRERGEDYFLGERVAYVEICGTNLRAIVEGSKAYEVTAHFYKGEISEFLCTCPCFGTCKHEYAVLLYLKETLKAAQEEYCFDYDFNYLAMMPKSTFFEHVVDSARHGYFKFDGMR